ncbi:MULTISPECIES: type III-B CRISPR module RAMP protein Cmr4 [Methylomicrobium]|uniref:CRISPR type III-B/RAMP module RAMP protein Cmr4 n=1 Tax=Methylomicrobium album BG8 TaxID=686340 RepID=H8GGR9_METAL|nr:MULTISPECIES: type III-B CRISPR module RAMP protein Cmr4 [Methylomicrobium]EIC30032.1 CRISPR type III-B/RAMP module RAMP protein Cmr4 [Methylomicrobium album BG8]
MFQETRIAFLYCVSPVHMGTGTAVGGLIDNPIQRERHTEYPMMAGSGIKGAIRHDYWAQDKSSKLLNRLFGPENDASEHAGALSFSDGQLAAFPVRCPKAGYVYATSPLLLARLKRQLALAKTQVDWVIPNLESGKCRIINPDLMTDSKLALEAYELEPQIDPALKQVAEWLAANALPESDDFAYFRKKLADDLVLLSDDELHYFVVNSTVVEPHVRIDDISGTADGGALFYTENLPPESILFTVIMASQERYRRGDSAENRMDATQIINTLVNDGENWQALQGRMVQFGGDASTGRGQIVCSIVGGGHE